MSVTTRLRTLSISTGRAVAVAIVVAWLGFNAAHAYQQPQQPPQVDARPIVLCPPATGHDLLAHLKADEAHWRQTMRHYDAAVAFARKVGDGPLFPHLARFKPQEHAAGNTVVQDASASMGNDSRL